jgi:hypothetical protein
MKTKALKVHKEIITLRGRSIAIEKQEKVIAI